MIDKIVLGDVVSAAVMLFFILDPVGGIPVFNTVLAGYSNQKRRKIVFREMCIALVILMVFLFLGTAILSYLGLKKPSLSIAGGIILFVIAIRMVFPQRKTSEYLDDDEPFIVPLAMPLVAGPSAIAFLMIQSTSQPAKMLEWALALLIAWALATVILLSTPLIMRIVRQKGIRALERLMGMLLIMVAVQMFLDGVAEYLPG